MNDENDHDQGTEHIEKGILDKLKPNDKIANANSEVKTDKTDTDGEAEGAEKISPIKAIGDKVKGAVDSYKDNKEYQAYTERQQKANPSEPPISRNVKHNGEAMWKEENERLIAQENGSAEPPEVAQTDAANETGAKKEQSGYVPMGGNITPEQVAQFDARQEKVEEGDKKKTEEKVDEKDPRILSEKKGSVLDDGAESRQQKEWKPSVTSQRMMDAGLAGLNMFGGIIGGANKAFSMLRGLASALTSRQLMSDPTLPARGFLNAMEQSGQIVEDHIRQVGEAYGIKDGVKRDDLVGTYKGAQYYREKQQIENAEKQYYAGVGNALSAVLGNNVDVNDTVGIQNALAQMTPQQLSQLDDALFGRNGSLKDMYEATVVNPMGSTREQKARAQLLTTLNQSLKGQAQANAREAGRQRTQANQQIQQYNQEIRRIKAGQEKDIANSNQLLSNPQAMASMTDDAQMEIFVNAVLGRKINNKQIPTNQNGEVEVDKLGSSDLNHLREVLSRPEFQNLSGAQKLRANVVSRLEAIKQSNAQYNQAYRQSQFAQYANSPLDIDLDRRKGLDRDGYGIPNSSKGREGLMNRAYMIRDELTAKGGSRKDIDLCDNVIMMCRMADMRNDLMGRIDKLEEKGAVSPLLAEHLRNQAQSAYRRLNDHLAVSYDERERRIRSNLPWSQGLNSDIIRYEMGGINSSLDRMETDLNNARQAPRMAELAKIEEREKDEAALDDRGVPRGLQVYRNRMRKALNGNLASIETEMATLSMNSPEDHFRRMALAQEKLNIEQQLLRVGQEDHIQKMLSDARAHGLGDQAEAAANRLRERYSDWNDFGEALNQERRAMGMPDDTKWNATASAQRAQGLQNQTQALINAIGSLEQAMKGQPGAMKDMLKDFLGDKDVLDKVKDILHENNIDLKHMIIGKGNIKMHGVVVNAIKDAFTKNIQKKITGMFQTAVSNALGPVSDRLTDIQSAVSDLGDAQKSGIISAVNGVNSSLGEVRGMFTQCLNDSATGQPIKVEELRNSLNDYMQSNQDLIEKLNEKIPLGGTNDDKYGIPSDVLEQLQKNQEAIKTQNENLESLVKKLDAGMVTREELADVVDKLSKVAEKEPSGTELDSDGNSLTQLRNKIEDMIDKGGYVLGFISNFAKDREAQGLDPAVPIVSLEDPMNSFQAFFETLANKVEEDAMNSEQDQNEAPSGAVLDNAREDASETVQETVPEATEPKEGEIYENRYVDPNTGVYTPPAEKPVDPAGKVDMAVDELLDSLPALKEYTSKNPETLKFLRSEGPNGAVHQTLRDAAEKAERNELFDGHAANVVLSMMDDLLSQTSRPQFKDTVKDWLQIADSQGDAQQVTDQRGVVQNIATMAETALEGVFQRDLARRLSMPPENVSEGTGETDPEAESIRRGLRIMEESLIEAQELTSQGLDEDQVRQKMAESQAEQKKVAEEGTKAIVPEQDSEVGKRMAESVRDTLFYSKKGPQWADYRSVMDQLADMKERYPQEAEQIDKVREDIVLGMVVPQLMGFKNVANVAPSDKLSMDKIKEISRRAMEFGLAKRQEVTDRVNEATLAGKDYKFSKEDEYWLGFPTVDELVNSHIYGRNSDKDPVNINRARVHRQEGGNQFNNRLRDVYKVAKKEATIRDNIQAKVDDLTSETYNPFVAYNKKLGKKLDYKALLEGTKDTLTNRTPIETLRAQYKSGELTSEMLDAKISEFETTKDNALAYKREINNLGSTLYTDTNLKVEDGEGGEVSLPEDALEEINNARRAKRDAIVDQDWVKNGLSKNGEIVKYLKDLKALRKTNPKQNVAQEETSGPEPIKTETTETQEIPVEEEEDATEYVDDSQLTDGLDPNVIFD